VSAFAEAGAVAPVDWVPGRAAVLLLVGLQPVAASREVETSTAVGDRDLCRECLPVT
jgi:hypothetical protein